MIDVAYEYCASIAGTFPSLDERNALLILVLPVLIVRADERRDDGNDGMAAAAAAADDEEDVGTIFVMLFNLGVCVCV
jgi:hypothetical protein